MNLYCIFQNLYKKYPYFLIFINLNNCYFIFRTKSKHLLLQKSKIAYISMNEQKITCMKCGFGNICKFNAFLFIYLLFMDK